VSTPLALLKQPQNETAQAFSSVIQSGRESATVPPRTFTLPGRYSDSNKDAALAKIITDWLFYCPTRTAARVLSEHLVPVHTDAPLWMYAALPPSNLFAAFPLLISSRRVTWLLVLTPWQVQVQPHAERGPLGAALPALRHQRVPRRRARVRVLHCTRSRIQHDERGGSAVLAHAGCVGRVRAGRGGGAMASVQCH
jgi:hypothetical protein